MPGLSLRFHRLAFHEYREAFAFYQKISEKLGSSFLLAVDEVIAKVLDKPDLGSLTFKKYRWKKVRRFPYYLYYLVQNASIQVLAFAHGRRRKGYWRKRRL